MASLRQQFNAMTPPDVKKTITTILDFIKTAAPFPDTVNLANEIIKKIESLSHDDLALVFTKVIDLILYYDQHKNTQGFFLPVHKQIILDKLQDIQLSLLPRPTPG